MTDTMTEGQKMALSNEFDAIVMDMVNKMGQKEAARELLLKHTIPTLRSARSDMETHISDKAVTKESPFEDLAIVLVMVLDNVSYLGSTEVTSEWINISGLTEAEVWKAAVSNLEKDAIEVTLGEEDAEDIVPMTSCGNKKNMDGSAAILLKSVQKRLLEARNETDYYMLPSSVHETIVIPMQRMGKDKLDDLSRMVRDVNKEHLMPKDVLSDRTYTFHIDLEKALQA